MQTLSPYILAIDRDESKRDFDGTVFSTFFFFFFSLDKNICSFLFPSFFFYLEEAIYLKFSVSENILFDRARARNVSFVSRGRKEFKNRTFICSIEFPPLFSTRNQLYLFD